MSHALPSTRRAGWRRSPPALLGIGVLVLLLVALGYLGYQLLGTTLLARRAYERELVGLRAQWQQPAPTSTARTGPSPSPAAVAEGQALAELRVPAWGEDYAVPVLSGTGLAVLDRGIGHYPTTAGPGQPGNFALTAHRVTHGQPFFRLLDLPRGAPVVVETRDAVLTYVLDVPAREVTVQPGASWVLDPVPGAKAGTAPTQALITLVTAEDLLPTSDRSVAFGHLASTTNKG